MRAGGVVAGGVGAAGVRARRAEGVAGARARAGPAARRGRGVRTAGARARRSTAGTRKPSVLPVPVLAFASRSLRRRGRGAARGTQAVRRGSPPIRARAIARGGAATRRRGGAGAHAPAGERDGDGGGLHLRHVLVAKDLGGGGVALVVGGAMAVLVVACAMCVRPLKGAWPAAAPAARPAGGHATARGRAHTGTGGPQGAGIRQASTPASARLLHRAQRGGVQRQVLKGGGREHRVCHALAAKVGDRRGLRRRRAAAVAVRAVRRGRMGRARVLLRQRRRRAVRRAAAEVCGGLLRRRAAAARAGGAAAAAAAALALGAAALTAAAAAASAAELLLLLRRRGAAAAAAAAVPAAAPAAAAAPPAARRAAAAATAAPAPARLPAAAVHGRGRVNDARSGPDRKAGTSRAAKEHQRQRMCDPNNWVWAGGGGRGALRGAPLVGAHPGGAPAAGTQGPGGRTVGRGTRSKRSMRWLAAWVCHRTASVCASALRAGRPPPPVCHRRPSAAPRRATHRPARPAWPARFYYAACALRADAQQQMSSRWRAWREMQLRSACTCTRAPVKLEGPRRLAFVWIRGGGWQECWGCERPTSLGEGAALRQGAAGAGPPAKPAARAHGNAAHARALVADACLCAAS